MAKEENSILMSSLEEYRQLAINLGMDDAKIIKSSEVLIDERVRLKCRYPKCSNYGYCGNCPPYAPPLEDIRKSLELFRYGIFMMKSFPSSDYLFRSTSEKDEVKSNSTQSLMYEVVYKVESAAFREGYELATGFANGSCKKLYCPKTECSAIQSGGKCRFPLKSRGSMEGCGMRAIQMARNVGWNILPIGHTTTPEQVPYLMALGLVMID